MLTIIQPGTTTLDRADYVPQLLQPLVEATAKGDALEPIVLSIVGGLGFDSFMYGISANPKPNHESKSYVFTTLPREWVARYDQKAYIEVDPRIKRATECAVPLIWDQASEGGRDVRTDVFLADAAAHGIASGIAFGLHDIRARTIVVALNSTNFHIDKSRLIAVHRALGETLLFGIYFHEIFMKGVVEQGIAPKSQGAPLSDREKQCLTLAAHGQTSHDIAFKLDITERTVQFHFDGIRSKLAAANRQEAIAKAVAAGIIEP